jgi:site-specific DNA-cytosine methylase
LVQTTTTILTTQIRQAKSEEQSSNVAFLHDRLRELGYEIVVDVFTSSDYMLPQQRRRAFAVAIDCKAFGLDPQNAKLLLNRMLETARRLAEPALPLSKFIMEERGKQTNYTILKPTNKHVCFCLHITKQHTTTNRIQIIHKQHTNI